MPKDAPSATPHITRQEHPCRGFPIYIQYTARLPAHLLKHRPASSFARGSERRFVCVCVCVEISSFCARTGCVTPSSVCVQTIPSHPWTALVSPIAPCTASVSRAASNPEPPPRPANEQRSIPPRVTCNRRCRSKVDSRLAFRHGLHQPYHHASKSNIATELDPFELALCCPNLWIPQHLSSTRPAPRRITALVRLRDRCPDPTKTGREDPARGRGSAQHTTTASILLHSRDWWHRGHQAGAIVTLSSL